MKKEQWKGRVVGILSGIAPEIEPERHERFGVAIPDADASAIRTLGELVGYLDELAP